MKIVGITGGIGSGKSAVCRIFSVLGVPVFNADEEAKKIYADEKIKMAVKQLLGVNAYHADELDRAYVAKKVFSDKDLLLKLNAIIHPAVQDQFSKWCEGNSKAKYVLKEAAILFEAGADKGCDQVILVTAPAELRIARVMKRDGVNREDVEKRMKNQWSDEEKAKRSPHVIVNDEKQMIVPQVLKIHEILNV